MTGCASGLCRELAQLIVDRGWRLVATSSEKQHAADLEVGAESRVLAVNLDVTEPEQIGAVIANAYAKFGRIDMLVINAIQLALGIV